MWMNDLMKAVEAMWEFKKREICIVSVKPAVDGIVAETTYFTYIKFFYNDGHVEEHTKEEWE